jgi:hypothetical protein
MPPLDEEAVELLKVVGDYKHGSIRRVKLSNFLTYSEVEFSPGPRYVQYIQYYYVGVAEFKTGTNPLKLGIID